MPGNQFVSIDTPILRVVDLVGLAAQVFQHELDHLRGRLISDYKELKEVQNV